MAGKDYSMFQDATWTRNFTERNDETQRCSCTRNQDRSPAEPVTEQGGLSTSLVGHVSRRWLKGSAIDKGRATVDRVPVLQGVSFSPSLVKGDWG